MKAIFLDIETSGLDPFKHRVFEIAFRILDAFSGVEICSYQTIVKQPKEVWEERDLMSIEINGFSWDKLQSGNSIEKVRMDIIDIFTKAGIQRGQAVFICQNPSFDRAFFDQLVDVYTQEKYNWPYHWLDFASMHWALSIKSKIPGQLPFLSEFNLSKNAIAKQFGLDTEKYPHSAINGVNHLIQCYEAVVGFINHSSEAKLD